MRKLIVSKLLTVAVAVTIALATACSGADSTSDAKDAEVPVAPAPVSEEGSVATEVPLTATATPTRVAAATAAPVEPTPDATEVSVLAPVTQWPETTPRNSETGERKLEFIRFAIQQTIAAPQATYLQTVTRFEPSTVSSDERVWESVAVWNGAYDDTTGEGLARYEFQTNAPWIAEPNQRLVFLVRQAGGLEWTRISGSAGDRWIGSTDLTPAGVASSTRAFLDIDSYLGVVRPSIRSVETISPNPNGSLWIVNLDVDQMDALVRVPISPENVDRAPVSLFINLDSEGVVRSLSFQPTRWWQSTGFAEGQNEELWVNVRLELTNEDFSLSPCASPLQELVAGYGEVATCDAT